MAGFRKGLWRAASLRWVQEAWREAWLKGHGEGLCDLRECLPASNRKMMPRGTLPTPRVLSLGAWPPSLPTSLSLTTLAWHAGRVGPAFVVALGAAGLAGPVLAQLTKRTAPWGACAHHRWFLAGSSASEAGSGPGRDRHA